VDACILSGGAASADVRLPPQFLSAVVSRSAAARAWVPRAARSFIVRSHLHYRITASFLRQDGAFLSYGGAFLTCASPRSMHFSTLQPDFTLMSAAVQDDFSRPAATRSGHLLRPPVNAGPAPRIQLAAASFDLLLGWHGCSSSRDSRWTSTAILCPAGQLPQLVASWDDWARPRGAVMSFTAASGRKPAPAAVMPTGGGGGGGSLPGAFESVTFHRI